MRKSHRLRATLRNLIFKVSTEWGKVKCMERGGFLGEL